MTISQSLDIDLQSLNALISNDDNFSIVSNKAIFNVKNRNNELLKILLEERKKIMAQQTTIKREEIQWKLI